MKKHVDIETHIASLSHDVAAKAGVDVVAAEKVLRALHIESHIGTVASLTDGKINVDDVKLAYRLSGSGMIA